MRKRSRIGLAILLVAVVGGVGWLVLPPLEPVYKGERYSMWLDDYISSQGHLSEAETAIRHIGTNALPQLLKMLAAKDSHFKEFAIKLARKQSLISIGRPEAGWTQYRATAAFKVLGADAKLAVPGLIALLEGNESDMRWCVLDALSSIGPAASNAVPSIIQQIKGKDHSTRMSAVEALGAIHSKPELAVPALTAALHDSNPDVMLFAIASLRACGVDARPAVVELLKDPNVGVRTTATNVLKQIDRGAAAEAGVK
jgi:HEAT repeat protein